jgi:hypothetical protein
MPSSWSDGAPQHNTRGAAMNSTWSTMAEVLLLSVQEDEGRAKLL